MRYLIIPIAIVLYGWWTAVSIKDLKTKSKYIKHATTWWISFNIALILATALIILIYFSIKYW